MLRIIVPLLLLSGTLSAQRTLSGIVTDAADGKPLSFVNVFLKSDQQYGVLTNERGEYRINLNEEQLTDRLVFSLLSYQTHEKSLPQLDTARTVFNLQMETSFVELAEIIVLSDLGLRAIVQRAVDAVPTNYGTKKYLLRAYSREYNIDDGAYSQQVEAMVTIQDGYWKRPKNDELVAAPKTWIDQFRISDYRGNARERFRLYNEGQASLLNKYGWGSNALREQSIHWLANLGDEPMDLITFTNRGEYLDGRDTLIRIQYGYDGSKSKMDPVTRKSFEDYFTGEVLINKTDFAVLRNTQGDPAGKYYRDVVYQRVGDKYFVKQINNFGQFSYNDHTQTQYFNEVLYVTEVITDGKKVRKAEKGKLLNVDKNLTEVTTAYDPNFWERNEILRLLPAPEALELELSKPKSLDQQFRDNARRVKRDTMR